MAEPIDLPFGLCTRVGRRKHKFNRIGHVARMCPHATWRIRLNRPSVVAIRPYVKLLWPLVVNHFVSVLAQQTATLETERSICFSGIVCL